MSITALDIQQQGFEHSLRGYDIEQVDVFLERVATEVDALVKENAELKERLAAEGEPVEAEQAAAPSADAEEAATRIQQAEANAKAAVEQTRAVAAQAKATEEELAKANATIDALKQQLAEKNDKENAISNAFVSAQRAADTMLAEAQTSADSLREEARAEGERIYRESEAKARDFIREALAKKQEIVDETEELSKSCESFRSQYRALVEHFTTEANRKFTEFDAGKVSDAEVTEALPKIADSPSAKADALSADDMIEEID